jgi:uncharacterized protein YndB with AHSA1/START domain
VPIADVRKDPTALTMTVEAAFDAPIARIWQLWEDPRQLEKWWGPPTYPATMVDHDLTTGGRVTYYMTGPEGDKHHGWWLVLTVDPPRKLEIEDGFADQSGTPNPNMPTTMMRMELSERDDRGTVMTIETTFPSLEAMEQMTEMGMEEGITLAINQIDDLL